jgi:molecular chaperone HtpG
MPTISGEISIHTQNIFPIIKKWLYSEHEIFIRELVSNAYDAITKRNTISVKEGRSDLSVLGKVTIKTDKEAKTVTISDNGLGLDADDIQKYINQIAFSGAEEFVKQYQDTSGSDPMIGHFGLGFYSAFMVASKVEIHSLSYKPGAVSALWECDGSTSFSITEGTRSEIGTDIILHVPDDNEEYLFEGRIEELVKKYANFLPVEITVNDKAANVQNPLWVKSPTELKDEDYKAFYNTMFPYNPEPLFWIHLNVDYPFNLKGILYFPKLVHELDAKKGRIQLFCQQVFVSDSAKEVVPEFLTLLQGAIDCPELPLNVSRSFLQNDPYVQKISKHIVKKVADKLTEVFRADRTKFESDWEDIGPFVKYGMMSDPDFYDKTKELALFKQSNEKSVTITEYLEQNSAADQKILYSTNPDAQATYIKLCEDQGLGVLVFNSAIDTHFIQFLEGKTPDVKFVSVDSAVSDHLLADGEVDATDTEALTTLFKDAIGKEDLKLQVESLKDASIPSLLSQPEYAKRFKEMSAMMGQKRAGMPAFDDYTLVINRTNPLVKRLLALSGDDVQKDLATQIVQHIYDLALIGQKPLSGDETRAFVARSTALLTRLAG